MEYTTVGEGFRRTFTVTVGLRVGYDPKSVIYHPSMVEDIVDTWMEDRLRENSLAISGFFTEIKLHYARGETNATQAVREPGLRFWGEVSIRRHGDKTDKEIVVALNNLADTLGKALSQVDITVSYRDKTWVRHTDNL